jgi:hypothetical protein
MFEDVEDEFELDIIHNRDSDDEEEKKSATRRRLSKKMNFSQVINVIYWKFPILKRRGKILCTYFKMKIECGIGST